MANYGDQYYCLAGFYWTDDIVESYFNFTFVNIPKNWIKAEISLDIWSVTQTMNLSICLIEENWDEYSINFLNRPEKGRKITNLLITESGIYKFDISDYIEGRNNISICVYIEISNYVDDYVFITSKEGYFFDENAPQLIWIYEKEPESGGYDGGGGGGVGGGSGAAPGEKEAIEVPLEEPSLIMVVVLISSIGGSAGIGIMIILRRKKNRIFGFSG